MAHILKKINIFLVLGARDSGTRYDLFLYKKLLLKIKMEDERNDGTMHPAAKSQ